MNMNVITSIYVNTRNLILRHSFFFSQRREGAKPLIFHTYVFLAPINIIIHSSSVSLRLREKLN